MISIILSTEFAVIWIILCGEAYVFLKLKTPSFSEISTFKIVLDFVANPENTLLGIWLREKTGSI